MNSRYKFVYLLGISIWVIAVTGGLTAERLENPWSTGLRVVLGLFCGVLMRVFRNGLPSGTSLFKGNLGLSALMGLMLFGVGNSLWSDYSHMNIVTGFIALASVAVSYVVTEQWRWLKEEPWRQWVKRPPLQRTS